MKLWRSLGTMQTYGCYGFMCVCSLPHTKELQLCAALKSVLRRHLLIITNTITVALVITQTYSHSVFWPLYVQHWRDDGTIETLNRVSSLGHSGSTLWCRSLCTVYVHTANNGQVRLVPLNIFKWPFPSHNSDDFLHQYRNWRTFNELISLYEDAANRCHGGLKGKLYQRVVLCLWSRERVKWRRMEGIENVPCHIMCCTISL